MKKASTNRRSLTSKATAAMQDALDRLIADHRRRHMPLAVWQDGKVVRILPAQLAVVRETPATHPCASALIHRKAVKHCKREFMFQETPLTMRPRSRHPQHFADRLSPALQYPSTQPEGWTPNARNLEETERSVPEINSF